MTIVAAARVAALGIAALLCGCGRATSSSSSTTVTAVSASPPSTAIPAAGQGQAVRSLQAQLARVTAERDEARAQLEQALARERSLNEELARYRAPVAPEGPHEAHTPQPPGQQTFKSTSTQPTP